MTDRQMNYDDARRMLVRLLARPGDIDKPLWCSRDDRLFGIASCAALMIEYAISEAAGYNPKLAREALTALHNDMIKHAEKICCERAA